jgi:hypothetical protein
MTTNLINLVIPTKRLLIATDAIQNKVENPPINPCFSNSKKELQTPRVQNWLRNSTTSTNSQELKPKTPPQPQYPKTKPSSTYQNPNKDPNSEIPEEPNTRMLTRKSPTRSKLNEKPPQNCNQKDIRGWAMASECEESESAAGDGH